MADCRSRDVNTGNMATIDVLLVFLTTILSVVSDSVHDMQQDEVQTNTFDVKPGAGRQNSCDRWCVTC